MRIVVVAQKLIRRWSQLLIFLAFAAGVTVLTQRCNTTPPGGDFAFTVSLPGDPRFVLSGEGTPPLDIRVDIYRKTVAGTTWSCSLAVCDNYRMTKYEDVQDLDTAMMKDSGYHICFNPDLDDWRRTGTYSATARLVPANHIDSLAKTGECTFIVIYNEDEHIREVAWAGDRAIAAPGESLVEARAYSLWAQTAHEDLGPLNGIHVDWCWKPDSAGELFVTDSTSCSLQLHPCARYIPARSWFPHAQGLSHAWFLPSANFTGRCTVITKMSLGDSTPRDSAVFEVRLSQSEHDSGPVGFQQKLIHEGCWNSSAWTWTFYPGDGYGLDSTRPDPAPTVKNILVEVDYDDAIPSFTTMLDSARRLVDTMFATAGVKCSLALSQALNISPSSDRAARALLHQYRDDSLASRGYVHLMLGGRFWAGDDVIGANLAHQEPELFAEIQHLATSDWNGSGTNDHLDSVGIFVFRSGFEDTVSVDPDSWTRAQLCANIMVHELGHAAGLYDRDSIDKHSVMIYLSDWTRTSWPRYDSFKAPAGASFNKMNTRFLLGRDKLNAVWPEPGWYPPFR